MDGRLSNLKFFTRKVAPRLAVPYPGSPAPRSRKFDAADRVFVYLGESIPNRAPQGQKTEPAELNLHQLGRSPRRHLVEFMLADPS